MRTDENLTAIANELQRNCGDLHAACRVVGVSPHFLMTWMRDDAEATKILEEAQRVGWMGLESAAIQRGVHGVEKDVWYKGESVGKERVYSDSLLGKLLEARVPAYKKGEQGGNTFNGPTQINVMPRASNFDEWLKMKDATLERRAQAALPAPVEVPEILQGTYVEVVQKPTDCLRGLI